VKAYDGGILSGRGDDVMTRVLGDLGGLRRPLGDVLGGAPLLQKRPRRHGDVALAVTHSVQPLTTA
jgi:hypothetical protein